MAATRTDKGKGKHDPLGLIIVGVVGLCVAAGVGYDKIIHPNLFPKRFGVVVDDAIYRSGELTPASTRLVVERHGIRTIVDLGAHEPGTREEALAQATADALGVRRIVMNLEGDATGDPNYYVDALEIMTDASLHPVLVHCAAGSQRTGCAVAMYRQIFEGESFDDAYRESWEYDHDPDDDGSQLRQMLERWTAPVEAALESGGEVEGWADEATDEEAGEAVTPEG
ncbi:MAG: tyrosine-protein phosphatase [Planctomycetota bacterium]